MLVWAGVTALSALAFTWYATGWLRTRLTARRVLDEPNERSLHRTAVPRGGGLAIAASVCAVQCIALLTGAVPLREGLAWMLAGAAYAALGWADDRRGQPVARRLLVQAVIAVAFVLAAAGGIDRALAAPGEVLMLLARVFTVLWLVNLFNFMDGADGFAATQAALSALAASAALAALGLGGATLVAVAVAGASIGFLRFNRPPASLFMGDCGSYFLGFQLAALGLAGCAGGQPPAAWLIVCLPFLADASLTLGRRLLTGARWWRAHREHAYQRLVLNGWSHARLVKALVAVNVLVCWPLALWAFRVPAHATSAAAIGIAIAVMIWVAITRRHPVAEHHTNR